MGQLTWSMRSFAELSNQELYEICAARQEVFVVGQKISYIDCDGKDQQAWHIQGRQAETQELVAYLRILPPGLKHRYHTIGRVLIRPEYRGQGFGHELMRHALAFANQAFGDIMMAMAAQSYLEAFYQFHGFVTVSDTFLEEGIQHVMMEGPSQALAKNP
ncbi:MAG: GNAT family N-acetyltransferase [Oligoflexus sp.]